MHLTPLLGKVVLITGAGRWPAPALALAFARAGARVLINDLSPVPLDAVRAQAEGFPGQVDSYVADATRGMPLRALFDTLLEQYGRLDVLVNNPRVRPSAPMRTMDEWDWQRTMEMNVNGPFLAMQLAANAMQPAQGEESGGGVILNLIDPPASLSAPGLAAYAASQAALLALSEAASREFLAYNIRVYTICPEGSGEPPQQTARLAQLALELCSPAGQPAPAQTVFVINQQEMPR